MKFNINDTVRVRLTDHGRQLLKEQHKAIYRETVHLHPYQPPKEDENGWSKWQLWVLMGHFGHAVYNGCKLPFETTIEIVEEKQT